MANQAVRRHPGLRAVSVDSPFRWRQTENIGISYIIPNQYITFLYLNAQQDYFSNISSKDLPVGTIGNTLSSFSTFISSR